MVCSTLFESPIDAARSAAAELYLISFPLLLTDAVRRAHPVGLHQFRPVSTDRGVLAPGLAEDDPRVIVSSAFIDLEEEPVVVRLPNTHGRHINLTLIDSAGEPFASFGSRTGDDLGVDLALVGPQWRGELSCGLRARRAPSVRVWAASRLRARSALDLAAAQSVAALQSVVRLRARLDGSRPQPAPVVSIGGDALAEVGSLTPQQLLDRLDEAADHAPLSWRRALLARLQLLRDQLGGPDAVLNWSGEFAAAAAEGFRHARAAISSAAQACSGSEGLGWRAPAAPGIMAPIDPLAEAARAFASLGAPVREDLLCLTCSRDQAGQPLSGAGTYRLRFERGALPPVDGLWRLSVRPASADEPGHSLGDHSDVEPGPDGSLEIVIQHAPPAAAQIPNWLRAPRGDFALVMRLCCPRPDALSGAWRMPQVVRVAQERERAGRVRRFRPLPSLLRGVAPAKVHSSLFAWRMMP